MKWQDIWQGDGSNRLWSVPDRQVVELVDAWKREGTIRRVLDIGCGLGRHAYLFAKAGFEVYGSDHAEEAIDRCRTWFDAENLEGHFWCGELDDIPYEDGFFDAVIGFNSLYHGLRDDLIRVASTIHAKTRKGGKCFVTLASQDCRLCGTGEKIAPHTYRVGAMFDGLFDHDEEKGELHYFSSEEDVRQIFSAYRIDSLTHEELHLASGQTPSGDVKWLRIPKALFWNLHGTKAQS